MMTPAEFDRAYDRLVLGTEPNDDEQPVVPDETFMENVREALANGYDRVCAHCGVGTAPDGMDIHERRCAEFDERSMR